MANGTIYRLSYLCFLWNSPLHRSYTYSGSENVCLQASGETTAGESNLKTDIFWSEYVFVSTVYISPMVEVGIPKIIYLNHLRNDTEKLLHDDVNVRKSNFYYYSRKYLIKVHQLELIKNGKVVPTHNIVSPITGSILAKQHSKVLGR